jgi:hypothetical protein
MGDSSGVFVTVPFLRYKICGALWRLRAMDQKSFFVLAGGVFALVAIGHLLRIYMDWSVVIGSWSAPMWLSWICVVVAGGLSFLGLRLATRS